jgi:hypothetical protein
MTKSFSRRRFLNTTPAAGVLPILPSTRARSSVCSQPSRRGLSQQFTMKDTDMMLDWNDYRRQLAAGVKEIGQVSPDTIMGYRPSARLSKYPPAKPGTLGIGPLKAAIGVANATPVVWAT